MLILLNRVMRVFLLLVFVFLSLSFSFAQLSNIRFDLISIEDGLSQSTPNAILQDSKGFIWIGTQDGLNLYDGHKFRVFHNDPDDTLSLCDNFIHAILENGDGSLWIGTENGLNLYDRKQNKFYPINFNEKNKDTKRSNIVYSLLLDEKNNLWVGTDGGGLYCLSFSDSNYLKKNYSLKHYTTLSKNGRLNNDVIKSIVQFNDLLLIGTANGGMCTLNRSTEVVKYFDDLQDNSNFINSKNVNKIVLDNNKRKAYVATEEGVVVIRTNDMSVVRTIRSADGLADNNIQSLLVDREGNLWIGTVSSGLNKLNTSTGRISHYFNQPSNPHSLVDNRIIYLYEDNAGVIWVGTNNGVNKFDRIKQNFTTFRHIENNPASLASSNIWSLYEDENNVFWVGTDYGIDRIDRKEGTLFHYYTNPGSSSQVTVYSILKWNNYLLCGTDYGILYFDKGSGKFHVLKSKDESYKKINNKKTYQVFIDRKGNIWGSTREGLVVLDANNMKFSLYANNPENKKSLPYNIVRCALQDKNGDLYFGTSGGGLVKANLQIDDKGSIRDIEFESFYNISGNDKTINNNTVLTMYEDVSGDIWIGTYGGGLNRFNTKQKTFIHYTESDGLCNNVVYGIVPDKTGNIWMSTNKGLSQFNPKTNNFQNYFEQDGLQSNEFNTGAYAKGNSGSILFGGIKGFNLFYPSRFKKNTIPPNIVLTGLWLFNKEVMPGKKSPIKTIISEADQINLSFKENSFNIEFSALHFSNPSNNKYMYMLEGIDEEWNNVGNKNYATYTKIEPGEYVFKVKAANSDGVWSKEELAVKLIITPPYWKTMWFRVVLFLAISLFLWFAYRTRINLIKQQKKYLESQIRERTQKIWQQKEEIELKSVELAKEREKVEKLLLNILPEETAAELKTKGKASPRHYRLASVMFTDFKGFTLKSENLRPQELVEELDFYFVNFDEIIAKYNISKIKTIGDAYMAAGGVPIRNKSNPIDLILAGLEIQRFVIRVKEERQQVNGNYFECRVGIHTGEIIAGVVGINRFAYDIWGDTVNVASRMEASSEVGKVNISGITYQVAKEFFVCTHRGKIEAKNKGEIDMYFVESIKPELSIDGLGIIPNDKFTDRLEHILYSKINYKKAEHHIVKLLEANLPSGLFYHGLHHTLDVCKSVEEIALAEGVGSEDIHILKTAALFHDAGFTKQYTANEPIGCQMAHDTLPEFGYSPKQIKMVEELILATIVPQKPNNHLEQIICDADLDYLGRDVEEFYQIAQTLYEELEAFGKINDPVKWDEIQVSFLSAHQYFTKTNIKRRQPNKLLRIQEIKDKLAKIKGE